MREAEITVGYVAMEGQGALIHCGKQSGEQAILDIGERTVDALPEEANIRGYVDLACSLEDKVPGIWEVE